MDFTRREIIKYGSLFCLSTMLGLKGHALASGDIKPKEFEIFSVPYAPYEPYFSSSKPVVGVVRVNEKLSDGKAVEYAVTKALDLIGGLGEVTKGKERILLKPNLVSPTPSDTTKPAVVEALATLMKKAGKKCLYRRGRLGFHAQYQDEYPGLHLQHEGPRDAGRHPGGYLQVSGI